MIYIGILHYKTIEKTVECVESILTTNKEARIVIADNHSNDGTLEILKNKYSGNKRISIIEFSDNLGFSRGNNEILRYLHAKGANYCILTNNDILFLDNSISDIELQLNKNENAIVVPMVIDLNGEICDSVQLRQERSFLEHILNKKKEANRPFFAEKQTQSVEVEVFSGCCFGCNIKRLSRVGFFDPDTFLYYEEQIMSMKLRKKGETILFHPIAKVFHYHATSTRKLNYLQNFYMLESEMIYLKRYLKVPTIVLRGYMIAYQNLFKKRGYPADIIEKVSELKKGI